MSESSLDAFAEKKKAAGESRLRISDSRLPSFVGLGGLHKGRDVTPLDAGYPCDCAGGDSALERFNDFRRIALAFCRPELTHRSGRRPGALVRPSRRHGVEAIGHSDDGRGQGDFGPGEVVGVAGAVPFS